MTYKDPDQGRERGRERFARRTAERLEQGLCWKCGRATLEPAPVRDMRRKAACRRPRRSFLRIPVVPELASTGRWHDNGRQTDDIAL